MKLYLLMLLIFPLCTLLGQNKWEVGLVAGGSSKLRMGVPHKDTQNYSSYYVKTTNISPFAAFVNGGVSARLHFNEKHFLQGDIMFHRMDIRNKFFYTSNMLYHQESWQISKLRFHFLQMPITYNWHWTNKKLRPFLGLGIAPTYILNAKYTEISQSSLDYQSSKIDTLHFSAMEYHGLQGIRRIKLPLVCEIGIKPFPNTTIAIRSSFGVYLKPLGHYEYFVLGRDVITLSQNINMFSLIAKVYLSK